MRINTVNKNICLISTKLDKMKSSTVHIIEKLHFIKNFNMLPYWSPNCLLFLKYWMLTDVDMVYIDIYTIFRLTIRVTYYLISNGDMSAFIVTSSQLFGAFIYHFQICQSPFQKLTKGHQFLQLENSRNLSSWMLLLKDQ